MYSQAGLLIMAGGGIASMGLLGAALRNAARDTRLERRVAGIARFGLQNGLDPAAPYAPPRLPLIEALLLCFGKDREEVVLALRAADLFHPSAVLLFAAARLAATLAAGVVMALLAAHWGGLHGMERLYPFAASVAVFIGAKIALRSRVAARTRQINRELPFMLDLMSLMLESGVSLDQCFRHMAHSAASATPAVRRVLVSLVEDLQKGMPYEMALDRWADRMAVTGARELASVFRQSLLHGTELTPALRSFAQEFSEKRVSAAREVIGKKTAQMTVVMILFLMPALMIIMIGPAVHSVMSMFEGLSK